MARFDVPFTGPGSQPREDDGAALDFMAFPSGMMTFQVPNLREPEEAAGLGEAMAVLESLLQALREWHPEALPVRLPLDHLDAANRAFVDELLGEGEVSLVGPHGLAVQESVLAGVWRVQQRDGSRLAADAVEVGEFPAAARAQAAAAPRATIAADMEALTDGVVNAPPLLTELAEHLHGSGLPHVINLTLLPQTGEDIAWLEHCLGRGELTVLSRGYGNCRIDSTATRRVWWVRYFNSQDALILNTLEVSDVPAVACAAVEDIADSAERLDEILAVYR